jgi:hypothetical protein
MNTRPQESGQMIETAKNRIMIFGPKPDGTYVVEFKTSKGETLAISVPAGETAVLRHFRAQMPYGLFVPWGVTLCLARCRDHVGRKREGGRYDRLLYLPTTVLRFGNMARADHRSCHASG